MSLDGPDKGEMGLPAVTGLRIVLSTSPNKSGRGVVVALMHVGTNVSGLSIPPVIMKAFPGGAPIKSQYPPHRPMVCDRYPYPKIFVMPLSGCGPHSGCDLAGGGGLISRQ